MFCPRCAAQNLDDAKFCRGCGTGLESVALALSGEFQAPTSWMELRKSGLARIVRGGGLLSASVLVGAAMGIFSGLNDWIFVWIVFAGWMACWGVFATIGGITDLIDSNFKRRQEESELGSSSLKQRQLVNRELATAQIAPPSVAEQTTRSLNDEN